jgi:2-dehydro-3-deoxygluconokinase
MESRVFHPELDIVAIGEPMVEFNEDRSAGGAVYRPGHGGDTSNAIIAAARQGAHTAYFTHLGDDAFGRQFLDLWDQENVGRGDVVLQAGARTGIYFVTHGPEGHAFSYYRAGSAASLVGPRDIPDGLIEKARVLHVSGISQAISTSACDMVFAAIQRARQAGRAVSYDTNLRLRLWPLERARAVIHAGVAMSDIALPGLDDAEQLTGLTSPEAICDFYLGLGVKIVALTMGKNGTMVAVPGERRHVPARVVTAVDATGAGDTFDGAFLAEWLRGCDAFVAAAYANAAAALSTQGYGAVAPIPKRAAVEAFMKA